MMLFEELKARGLIHQVTDPKIQEVLNRPPVTAFVGIDPTSDSLHVGNLLVLVTLRRLQLAGHKIILLVGGATGFIGDPSGKTQERQLLDSHLIEKNIQGIGRVISRFISVDGNQTKMVNNWDWFKEFSILDFLRDAGKHFTVNYMTAKESVQTRLQDREHGLSYTEFSYMLLQAYDFYYLNKHYGCNLQLGGADQWGNITAGIELIRRKSAAQNLPGGSVYGCTWPLVTKADGSKFGKSESGNVWLSEDKTKPYDFYQFFLRTQDTEVIQFLKYFTFLSLEQIEEYRLAVERNPEKREAQAVLARELTVLVHGEDEFQKAQKASASFFSSDPMQMSSEMLEQLIAHSPSTSKTKGSLESGIFIVDLLVETQLVSSKSQARKDIQGGGIYLNDQRVDDVHLKIHPDHLVANQYVILRKGKKTYHIVQFL